MSARGTICPPSLARVMERFDPQCAVPTRITTGMHALQPGKWQGDFELVGSICCIVLLHRRSITEVSWTSVPEVETLCREVDLANVCCHSR